MDTATFYGGMHVAVQVLGARAGVKVQNEPFVVGAGIGT